MKKILLDTSVIIDFLRQNHKANTLLYKLAEGFDLYISIITHTEIYAGKSVWEKREAQKEVLELFSGITILPLINKISGMAGKLKAYDHNRSLLDCIIAATAIEYNLELVTLNVKDFKDFKALQLFSR